MSIPTLRLAKTNDLQNLEDLESKSFTGDRLSRRSLRHFISTNTCELWCLEEEQSLLGYGLLLFRKNSQSARIYSLAIAPQAQGRKLGKLLLQHLEQRALQRPCQLVRLEVRQDNEAAIKLYKNMGYQKIKALRSYYEDGADGWRLQKQLKDIVIEH